MSNVLTASDRFGSQAGRKLRVAVGDSVQSRKVRNQTASWAAFIDRLKDPVRTKEKYKEYINASRERQDAIKDVGYYVPTHFERGQRKKKRMESRDMVTLDLDFADPDYREAVRNAFKGWSWALHSTHKHHPERPRLRLILPLRRPVTEDEYGAIARKLADQLDIEWFDDTTYEFSRVMHWPSVSYDGEYVYEVGDGAWVDPDEVLSWYDDWQDITQWPTSSRVAGRLHKAAEKAEDPRSKRGVVGAFCRAYDVPAAIEAFLSEIYEPTDDGTGRYTYLPGTTAKGAVVYDDGDFLYSHHGTDPCGGRLVNAFDLVRIHLFGDRDDTAREDLEPTALPSWKAMADWSREDEGVRAELAADIAEEFDAFEESEDADPLDDDDLGLGERKPDHRQWLKTLQRNKEDRLKTNLRNLTTILKHDPGLKNAVAYNEFSRDLVQLRDLPDWPVFDDFSGDLWTDHCDILVKYRLETVYDMQAPMASIREAIDLVGHEMRWHPVRDYLDSLAWDGIPRVETLWIDYLGAKDTPYHRETARKTMAAAVKRIFQPGCKFDYIPILESPQGARKSTFIRHLAGDRWFTDDLKSFDKTQQAVEVMKGKWCIEIAELHTFSKSEIETAKAFVSRQTDRVREAYGRRAMDFPRQCIFFGTTNDDEYLKDPTGNRRYWPIRVEVETIDTDRLLANVDQLWAEAVEIYRAGETLYLTEDVESEARTEQGKRTASDDLVGLIEEWMNEPVRIDYLEIEPGAEEFDSDVPKAPRDRVCAIQVWVELMGGSIERYTRREAVRINQALKRIEFLEPAEAVRFGRRYGRQRGFYRKPETDDLGL